MGLTILKGITLKTSINSLFLCSTPFQAKICLSIIDFLELKNFDVIYFTKKSSETDLNYFNKLKKNSKYSQYIYISKNIRGLNALFNLTYLRKVDKLFVMNKYDKIFLASFDNIIFRYILKKNPATKIYGFDDGAANIFPANNEFNDTRKRTVLTNIILKLPSDQEVIQKLVRHYSIYSNFDFFIEKNRVLEIPFLNFKIKEDSHKLSKKINFFIGQPFNEYLNDSEILKLKKWLNNSKIDYYILHPRENEPLVNTIPTLDKSGMLAEDIIVYYSEGYRPTIYSSFSTVLFNINSKDISKIYLSISNDKLEDERCKLIEKTGSVILKL